jgi:hypothetical protein
MFGKVKEWLAELKISRAAEESLSQQVQLLQQKVVQLQQELSAEVAAAAASAAQIKELNELNVKLSGHNNQQQVRRAIPSEPTNQTQKCNSESRRFTTWKR